LLRLLRSLLLNPLRCKRGARPSGARRALHGCVPSSSHLP
jgi:hypothetical protein